MKIGEKKDTVKKTYENMQCIIFEICNFFKNLDQEISKNTNIKRFGQTNILAQTNSNSYNNPDDMIRKFFGMIWVNKKKYVGCFLEFYDGDWKIIIKSDDNKIKSTNAEKIKFLKDDSNENLNNNENVYSFIDLTTECKDSKFESIVDLIKKEFKSC